MKPHRYPKHIVERGAREEKTLSMEGRRPTMPVMFIKHVQITGHSRDCYHCSASTVERVVHRCFDEVVNQRTQNPIPRVLGIDEHSIRKGGKYAVTLVDLEHHSVYEVIEGKSFDSLIPRIKRMKGLSEVKVVCMDLSSSFRSLANRLFPHAKVVADRFHVIKLILETFMEFCRKAEPDIRWKRGITKALRMHEKNLSQGQKLLLASLFKRNKVIETAYRFKENLCALLLLKSQSKKACVLLLKQFRAMIDVLLHDAPAVFNRLGQTLREWFEPIIRMWRFTKSNGITEGFHRKMKLIQRRAFGFRNFENYRLRVIMECGHR